MGGACQEPSSDGAFSRDGRRSAAAAIFRNSDGIYMGGSVLMAVGLNDPGTMEALACREAHSLADDLNLRNLNIASDCNEVIEDIKKGMLGMYGPVSSRRLPGNLKF